MKLPTDPYDWLALAFMLFICGVFVYAIAAYWLKPRNANVRREYPQRAGQSIDVSCGISYANQPDADQERIDEHNAASDAHYHEVFVNTHQKTTENELDFDKITDWLNSEG